ncbi:3-beta-hydroxysteroid-Delta(8),Delta(7)-isomerase-like [Gordionus sp. m RMFG-2023]|uniref:3-beta-hydroxysteroid-Delta(8), Delta(7)-isomerase-like n=1 Tax=Gordionus sp. m RMFG-2023 TaxID=3053472 RepID=UPI0031FE10A8
MYIWRYLDDKSIIKRLYVFWFSLCGCIHCFLEGYFSLNHKTISADNTLLAQIWKEYALSDSRYMISDPFTLSMETVTAFFVGPLCFLASYWHIKDDNRVYILQLIISVSQIYGDVLYISTNWLENFKFTNPTDPFFFWFYFIFMNIIWIIVPSFIIYDSYVNLIKSLKQHDEIIEDKKNS